MPSESVTSFTSVDHTADPNFFLRFLDAAGIGRDRLIYRVQIHESADVAAAEQFWLALTAAASDQFRRTTLKRHNPKTIRKNVGSDYRGCLRVDVRKGSGLYHRIEGWARAAMADAEADTTPLEGDATVL